MVLHQDNNATAEEADQNAGNWQGVLLSLQEGRRGLILQVANQV